MRDRATRPRNSLISGQRPHHRTLSYLFPIVSQQAAVKGFRIGASSVSGLPPHFTFARTARS